MLSFSDTEGLDSMNAIVRYECKYQIFRQPLAIPLGPFV